MHEIKPSTKIGPHEIYVCTPVFQSFCNLKVITVFKLNTTSNEYLYIKQLPYLFNNLHKSIIKLKLLTRITNTI